MQDLKISSNLMAEYDETFKKLKLEEFEVDEVSFYLNKASLLRKQLYDNRQKIQEINEKWIRLIEQKESSKEQSAEQVIYEDFCDKPQNNFIEAIENATDAIDNLDMLIVDLNQATRQQKNVSVHETEHSGQLAKTNFQLAAKLNHPTFDGNIENWPTFSETFKAAIHNSSQYTEIEKLSYLLSYLKGEAAESTVGYPIIAASYKLVWSMLEEHFGDRDRLIHKMQTELRNLQPCKNSSQQELRRVYSTIARTTRCMTSFDVDCDNDQTIAIIEEKVPKSVLRELYIAKANHGFKKWSVERLIREFDSIIKLDEKIESVRPSNTYLTANKSFIHQQGAEKHTVMALHNKPKTPCILCNGDHWNSECTTYPDSDSRANKLREQKRCFTCLQKGHTSRNCEKQIVCKKCNRKHSTLLCRSSDSRLPPFNQRQVSNKYETSSYLKQHQNQQQYKHKEALKTQHQSPLTGGNATAIRQTTLTTQLTTMKKNGHLLSGIITIIKSDGKTKDVAALIDTCSTITLISDNLLKECGMEVQKSVQAQASQLAITTIGDQIAYYEDKWGSIEVATIDQNSIRMTAQVIPNLMKTVDIIVANEKGGTNTIETKAELLIGADYLYDIITDKPIKLDNNVFKLDTILGTAYGGGHSEKIITAILKKDDVSEKQKTNSINWTLDEMSTVEENDDETARNLFNEHITQDPETGRYTTKWLFKQDPTTLPTNIEVAYARLNGTLRGLKKSAMPNALEEYDAQIKAELASGTTELVQEDKPTGTITHYLCHHPVYKRDHRTHKLRIVYDASAKTRDGSCLNDYMYRGPITLPSIPGCILRFRSTKIGMVADVQKAFHQVGLSPKDRDFTRFLWIKDIKKPITSENIEIYRFTSLVFGVITSPSLLGMTIDAHLKNHCHPLAAKLRKDIYVDNVTFHVDGISDGIEKYKNSKKIFADANMNLREFMSNNQELNNYLMTQDKHEIPKLTKFLGVPWSLETDEFCFPLPVPPENTAQTTMRKVLEHIAKAYDICGLNAPALLKPKLFFQKLSYNKNGKISWDEALQQDDIKEWEKILSEWHGSSKLPRYLQALAAQESDLHVFTDASKVAICAVAYINDNEGNSNIILAQQRLASRRIERTIPDLEVAAILEGVKLTKFLRKEFAPFKDKMVTLYSDSKIALSYVKNGQADGVFANNRVKAIRGVPKITYQYVHTTLNPADIGTRGCTMAELNKSDMWNNGPKLVMQLPQPEPFYVSPETPIVLHPVVCMMKDQKPTPSTTNCLIDVSRYSTWKKALRITMKAMECANHLMSKKESGSKLHDRATILLISESQKRQAPSAAEVKQYNMFQDQNGLWRCKSRFSSGTEIEADPIYLPKHDDCTKLLISHEHVKQLHAGVNQTLTNMQQKFWYPQYRKTTKAVLRSCMTCRRLNAVPYSLPPMGKLPDDRTRFSPPFNNCGIDYLGPFTVRTTTGETTKTWIALFTCLAVRAVHLEIVPDLTAKSFLQCLRRFISRRGCPKTLISDNASTFKLANDVLTEADKRKLLECEIIWRNIPALSPWKGGVYERLVGIVKTASKAAIGKRIVDIHCFHTTVCEIEAAVNRRPLVYAAGDEPGFKALTPADFLMPTKRATMLLNTNDEDNDDDNEWKPTEIPAEKLLDHWRKSNMILEKFKERFHREYLPMLRERSRQLRHQGRHLEARTTPEERQIVLLRDIDNAFSNDPSKWPIAIITQLHNNKGNATLKMGNGKMLQRPINMLYPIELQAAESKSTTAPIIDTTIPSEPEKKTTAGHRYNLRRRPLTNLMMVMIWFILTLVGSKANTTTTLPCTTCAECTLGGIKLKYESDLESVRLCIYNRCFSFTEVTKNEILLLPISVTGSPYNAKVVAWNQNSKVIDTFMACDAEVICDLLKCRLCLDFIKNPQCDYVAAVLMAGAALIIICLISKIIGCVTTVSSCLAWIWRKVNRQRIQRRHRFTFNRRAYLFAIFFTIIQLAAACPASNTFTAHVEKCTLTANGVRNCRVTSSAIITSKISDRTICLLVKDNNNNTLKMIKILITKMELSCQQSTLFYTRDHKIKTVSSKRCPGAGSCVSNKCDDVKSDSKLDELSEGNNYPGYTHCSSSCGCAACGCFRCDDGCLFYRTFAIPTTKNIYKISQCTTFLPIITFQIIISGITENNEIEETKSDFFTTSSGSPITSEGITYTILSASIPPLPILTSKILIDMENNKARIIETSGVGQNVAGTVGQLQCQTQQAAQDFDCNFPPNICKCDLHEESASCVCPLISLKDIITEQNQALPLVTHGVSLHIDKANNIKALLFETTNIQMQVDFNNFEIATLQTNSTCQVTECKIIGCEDCTTSPFLKSTCSTNFGEATLELECPSFSTTTTCNTAASERTTSVTVQQNKKHKMENCTYKCPGGRNTVNCIFDLIATKGEKIAQNQQDDTIITKAKADDKWIDVVTNQLKKLNIFAKLWHEFQIIIFVIGLITVSWIILKRLYPYLNGTMARGGVSRHASQRTGRRRISNQLYKTS